LIFSLEGEAKGVDTSKDLTVGPNEIGAIRAYETQEIAHSSYNAGFFEAEFSFAIVRAFRQFPRELS